MGSQLPLKGAQPPVFGSCLLWPNGWMDKTPLGTEVHIGPGHIVLDGVPALRERGTAAPPLLLGPCLLWRRSPISDTAELLCKWSPKTKIKIKKQLGVKAGMVIPLVDSTGKTVIAHLHVQYLGSLQMSYSQYILPYKCLYYHQLAESKGSK